MLLREIQSIILTFDDGKEALKKYQEILEILKLVNNITNINIKRK